MGIDQLPPDPESRKQAEFGRAIWIPSVQRKAVMNDIERNAELIRRQEILLKALKKICRVPLRGPADMREAYLEGRAVALDQCQAIAHVALQEFNDDLLGFVKVTNPERMAGMETKNEILTNLRRVVTKLERGSQECLDSTENQMAQIVVSQFAIVDKVRGREAQLREDNQRLKELLNRWLIGWTIDEEANLVADTEEALGFTAGGQEG